LQRDRTTRKTISKPLNTPDFTMHQAPLSPDSLLYIYYCEGRISKDTTIVNRNYLGTWEEDGFSFLFFREKCPEVLKELTANTPGLTLLDTFEMTYEQWQGGKLEPLQIGRFLICPPSFVAPKEDPSIAITLDPGVVFGNGLHPTTRDCLQAIEIVSMGGNIKTMLDLGTGTGILALAAVALGCSNAIAVDFNFLAAQTTQNNIRLNHHEENIIAINGQAQPFTAISADLLVANIHYDVMKDIIRTKGFLQQKWFILSGLLRTETKMVEDYLASQPVHILQKWSHDGTWHTLLGITSQK
jgi:ribosomal protein L11 methyltransferase